MKTVKTALIVVTVLVMHIHIVYGDECDRLEKEGRLLHQQLRRSKVCKESEFTPTWTDCYFSAYGTRMLLVGAIGIGIEEKMMGVKGSGFYLLSVDNMARVRTFVDQDFGILLRIEGTDNLKSTGCINNEAYVTLDAQVLGPGELNEMKYGQIKLPESYKDKNIALQNDLRVLGYYSGEFDGVIGPQTVAAIEHYKNAKDLPKEIGIEKLRGLIALDAAQKNLEKMEDIYNQIGAPIPPLRRER